MEKHGVNALIIAGRQYLLVAGASKTHLAACVNYGDDDIDHVQPAVRPDRLEQLKEWQDHYDLDALQSHDWRDRTLCGLEWGEMEAGDGPSFEPIREPVWAPDCRSCLRVIARELQPTEPANGLGLIAHLAIDLLIERDQVSVVGVPGDQIDLLRQRLRAGLRDHDRRGGTWVLESGTVVAWVEPPADAVLIAPWEHSESVERPIVHWSAWTS